MRQIELISTGGTIEKTYNEATGELANHRSVVEKMLRRLKLLDTEVHHRALMHKDSLLMTDDDRRLIVKAVSAAVELSDAAIVLHGTDTLCLTGETLHRELPRLTKPVILTGAMRPYEMTRSDALQNLTEALLASSLLPAGVYAVAHGRALKFPGVVKDRELGSFRRA